MWMRIALVSPYSWTYPGRRHAAYRGAGRAVHRRGSSRPRAGALRSARHRLGGAAPRRASAGGVAAPDYLVSLGRTVGFKANGAVSNLVCTPYVGRGPAARAADRRLRRRPHPRAGRAAGRLGGHRLDPAAAGRHLPLLLREPRLQRDRQRDRRAARAQPPARPDRRVRGRRVDRATLVRWPLPDHPQRRRTPTVRRWTARRSDRPGDRLRIVFVGQSVERKGLPAAAARLRGAARAHPHAS